MSEQKHDHLAAVRHSLAHLLAASVKELYPGAQNAIGPAVDNGFYEDFDMGDHKLSEDDLPKIEARMKEKLKGWGAFETKEVSADEARKDFANNPYKLELIDELAQAGKTITENNPGDFLDLCKGGHADDLAQIDPESFKLSHTAGAYWRGDETKKMLTRIYGLAFDTKEALADYLKMQEEAKKRDHRRLGKELDLFVFSDRVGSGLPMYTPRGTVIRDGLMSFSEELRGNLGFQKVWTPHITKKELYEVSGHWAKFGNELFLVKSQETSDELVMKPMNCPHHNEIYASQPRSYRDLPIKYMEPATIYRDEKTGELHGLSRVRSITQDDSHAYCRPDQVGEIFSSLIGASQTFYGAIGMDLEIRLSFRDDSDQYLGDKQQWEQVQGEIEQIASQNGLKYHTEEGEAAFYGPKIDFMAIDAIGRKWQVATVQFDFVQPERFKLEYADEDGSMKQPIMVHCAIMGSFDRFFSVYIEHTAGKFPVWLAPEQIRLITINQEEKTIDFARGVLAKAAELGLRATIDQSNESVGKKIRNAEVLKVPYSIVIGEKEIASGDVTPRKRSDLAVEAEESSVSTDQFLQTVANEAKSRATRTSV